MAPKSKDSPEVAKFLFLFAKVKDWCDDDAANLPYLARTDEACEKLCLDLLKAAGSIQSKERSGRELFTAPVDPKFVSFWREFEQRFAHSLLIVRSNAFEAGKHQLLFSLDFYEAPVSWQRADFFAARIAKNIDDAVDFAHSQAEQKGPSVDWHDLNPNVSVQLQANFDEAISAWVELDKASNRAKEALRKELQACDDEERRSKLGDLLMELERDPFFDDDPMSIEDVVKGVRLIWKRLRNEAGFDLRGFIRRRRLIPFVFVPRHVAARHDHPLSYIYENLRQAHEAFVFGVPSAALALMRAIMEMVLIEHYAAQGNDLSDRINSVQKALPASANAAALHRLRRRANSVLHQGEGQREILSRFEPQEIETEIASLLRVIRALVEGAPHLRRR
jgi:hypothetical protein